jgi:hypothetical protein
MIVSGNITIHSLLFFRSNMFFTELFTELRFGIPDSYVSILPCAPES